MSDIVYTRQLGLRPTTSNVDEVFYNENTKELYVDLDPGDVYKYKNVPAHIAAEFEKADSVGGFYATRIKRDFGPSENLGNWRYLTYDEVDVNPVAAKVEEPNTFYTGGLISTTGVSTAVIGKDESVILPGGGPVVVNVTPADFVSVPKTEQFSLKPFSEPVKVEGVEREYIVTFEVEGIVDFKRHTLRSKSVDEAVQSVLDLGKMLDLKFIVREVCIKFE